MLGSCVKYCNNGQQMLEISGIDPSRAYTLNIRRTRLQKLGIFAYTSRHMPHGHVYLSSLKVRDTYMNLALLSVALLSQLQVYTIES